MSVRPDALELAEKNREIATLRATIKDLQKELSEYKDAWLKVFRRGL